MYWLDRKVPRHRRCAHYSHHLLIQCPAEQYGSTWYCEKHLAACYKGCPPVRLVWWPPKVSTRPLKFEKTYVEDSYGNPGRLFQVPFLGVLAVYRVENREMVVPSDLEDFD